MPLGTGVAVGTAVGTVIPGVGNAIGAALGSVYDLFSSGGGLTTDPAGAADQAKQKKVVNQWVGKLTALGYNVNYSIVRNDVIGTHWGGNWPEQVATVDAWKASQPKPSTNVFSSSIADIKKATGVSPALLIGGAALALKFLK